ncbi:MAG: SusC/RagA family TonB-linked outer membrane protein [Chitinophaga sp.]|uniref:SusC/RagA family TonB-linked outer membrane protein n=1 Tax=Chitinophaga sp. TaxID=1869181 RepID=UPI0025C4A5BF|nr:SusC/RagA family TonB-linked outer membrane protein [Chitinophaga sp.]MBV8252069.1 SusC/RagA family TonB-linked outer membrane protein [Chitinophaga sp.]
MKLAILLLTIGALQVSANGFSQSVTLVEHNARLENVFRKMEQQTGYYFWYEGKALRGTKKVDLNLQNVPLKQALDQCLASQPFSYVIIDKTIVIKDKKEIGQERVVETHVAMDITGTVVDESGNPLFGASVGLKGTTLGARTDSAGRFSIHAPTDNGILVVSYVGMTVQEVPVSGSNSNMRIVMKKLVAALQEVVAVGYGTQKRQAITGSVATANLKRYEQVPVNNVIEMVKGVIPGLNVGGINKAGDVASFSIRGTNSKNAGNDPLIVLDGAIFRGSLSDIAPADIESFTVLKDASAAAVYGSRSANGVILISTKKGSGINGKPKFTVNASYGYTNELKPLHVYDAPGYLQRVLDYRVANGLPADPNNMATYLQPIEATNYNATPDHQATLKDPYSLFRQAGQSMNVTASVSNRTDKTDYYISGNIIKQKGVIVNDLYNHYSLRVRVGTDLTKWFNLGINAYYSLKDYPGATIYGLSGGGSSSSPYQFSPYATLKGPDGSYLQFPQTTTSFNSPYWQIPNQIYNRQNSLNGILTAVIKAPWVQGLSYNLTTAITQNWNENGSFYGLQTVNGLPKNGTGDVNYNRNTNILVDQLIKYNRTFGDHSIDATLLYSMEDYRVFLQSSHGENFNDPSLGIYGLSKAQTQTVNTGGTQTAAIGEMGRLTYSYKEKYAITGTVRRDGFSAFSENHKYGVFSSVGANWQLSKERFMNSLTFLDNLALRASYGTNGNQSISPYGTLARMGNSKYFYNGSTFVVTQSVSSLGNSDLKWEYTKGVNLGVDFAVLHNRLTGQIDWYSKKTHNLIFPLTIPSTSGFGQINTNLGSIGNKGIEISLTSENVRTPNFGWMSNVAFARNWNKLITAYGPDPKTGIEADRPSDGLFIGKPLGTIYGYKVIGMWQQADKDNGTIMAGMAPGTYKLLDVNHDGKITSDSDRVFLGNSRVRFTWSFTNTFRYKDFSLMVYVYSLWGGNGYFLSGSNTPYNDGYANNPAINHIVYDYWTPTNTNAMFPRMNYGNAAAYKGVKYFDRSFIKLQKISLTYDFTKLVKRYGIHGLSFSVSADNLFTYAPHWVGLDPETDNGFTDGSIPSLRNIMGVFTLNF